MADEQRIGRRLTSNERRLLEVMLHSGVPAREKWLAQADSYLVEVLEDDDSLIFLHPPTPDSSQNKIAEAEYIDTDGMLVVLSARTIGEFLHVIDIYRSGDNRRTLAPIEPEKMDVYWPARLGECGWWEK